MEPHKHDPRSTIWALPLGLLAACGSTDTPSPNPTTQRPAGAVLLAERFNTPDGRAAYMGAFPAVPSGVVDISSMVELGPEGDTFACAGAGFFYNPNAGTITRWDVGDDLRLTQGRSINVQAEGIVGWTGAHVCASDTQAFIFNESGGRVVEWNPTTMVIVSAFDVPRPQVGEGLAVQFFEPKRAGNLVYFGVTAINWDTLAVEPRAIVATFDIAAKTLTIDTDDRCQGSLGGMVDAAGNFYLLPEDGGFFAKYSPTPNMPTDCVLRIRAGERTFDDGFIQRLPEGNSLRAMWPIDEHHTLAAMIPMSSAPPAEDMWAWYDLPIQPSVFDLRTGAVQPYPSVPNVQPMNSRKLEIDGKSYYQVYSFDAEARVARVVLHELRLEGATPTFTLEGGDILTLERLW